MRHFIRNILLTVVVLSLTAVSSHAQDAPHSGQTSTSMTLRVSFGSTPHWTSIHGTHVQQIRERERPDYDIFRYGGHYYAYQHGEWYMAYQTRGPYRWIDERAVPSALYRVPSEHWRAYPAGWSHGNQGNHSNGHDGNKHDNNGNHSGHEGEKSSGDHL
jgi:hypothetical protein